MPTTVMRLVGCRVDMPLISLRCAMLVADGRVGCRSCVTCCKGLEVGGSGFRAAIDGSGGPSSGLGGARGPPGRGGIDGSAGGGPEKERG